MLEPRAAGNVILSGKLEGKIVKVGSRYIGAWGSCISKPLSKQSKSSVKRGKPGILTVEQCVRLLSASAFPRLMTKFSQQSRSECLQVFAPSQKSGDWIGVR